MVDAEAAALKAVEVAKAHIDKLAAKQAGTAEQAGKGLTGFDAMDLDRCARICLAYENHRLTWLSKLDPSKLNDELLAKYIKEAGGDKRPARAA